MRESTALSERTRDTKRVGVTGRMLLALFSLATLCILFACTKQAAYMRVEKYLLHLPKVEKDMFTPYRELSLLEQGVEYYKKGADTKDHYLKAFDTFALLLDEFPDTDYELEVFYYFSQIIPEVLALDNEHIFNFVKGLYDTQQRGSNITLAYFVSNTMEQIGVKRTLNGFVYNKIHFTNIIAHEDFFAYKDEAYYAYSIKDNLMPFTKGETNYSKFENNLKYVHRFAQGFRSSTLIEKLYTNTRFFPMKETHKRAQGSNVNAANVAKWMDDIEDHIEHISPETNYLAFIEDAISVGVRQRRLIDGKYILYLLNDYDFVTTLKHTEKKTASGKTEDWSLVDVDTPYGMIRGWLRSRYIAPVETISTNMDLIYDFRKGLRYYQERRFVDAADAFAGFIISYETNYLSDKAYYLLWSANRMIAVLTTSQDNKFYEYVKKYTKYFVFDKDDEMLRCSNLIYKIIEKNFPQSRYKLRVNNQYNLE